MVLACTIFLCSGYYSHYIITRRIFNVAGKLEQPNLSCSVPKKPCERNTFSLVFLLSGFLKQARVCSADTPVQHDVTHHIMTSGETVLCLSQMARTHLPVARQEFEHNYAGIVHPSSSAW